VSSLLTHGIHTSMAHKIPLFSSLTSSCLTHLVDMNVAMDFFFKITVLSILKVQKKLSKNIKLDDKGSATVIMSREDNVTKAMWQLNKEEHYCQLDQDPTMEYNTQLIQLLREMKDCQSINEETQKFLTPLHVTTAVFYLLPKIHKPGNPGRPIVSS